jgi:hypothetical protein
VECANNDLGAEILEVLLLPPMGLASYEAEFVSASSETFNDRGTTNVEVQTIKGLGNEEDGLLFNADVAFFREGFLSDLEEVLPTKDQCKDGGYEQLGFVNEGDCVSFVVTGGMNAPK